MSLISKAFAPASILARDRISETIGEVEIEQLRESRAREHSPRFRASRNYQLERRIEPLQITGLEDRRGYLKAGNAVVQLSFPYVTVPRVHSALIKRAAQALTQEPLRATAAAAGADAPRSNGCGQNHRRRNKSLSRNNR
jgi:hypothetical protein